MPKYSRTYVPDVMGIGDSSSKKHIRGETRNQRDRKQALEKART